MRFLVFVNAIMWSVIASKFSKLTVGLGKLNVNAQVSLSFFRYYTNIHNSQYITPQNFLLQIEMSLKQFRCLSPSSSSFAEKVKGKSDNVRNSEGGSIMKRQVVWLPRTTPQISERESYLCRRRSLWYFLWFDDSRLGIKGLIWFRIMEMRSWYLLGRYFGGFDH